MIVKKSATEAVIADIKKKRLNFAQRKRDFERWKFRSKNNSKAIGPNKWRKTGRMIDCFSNGKIDSSLFRWRLKKNIDSFHLIILNWFRISARIIFDKIQEKLIMMIVLIKLKDNFNLVILRDIISVSFRIRRIFFSEHDSDSNFERR